ncbi:MAG: hypothetical protein ACLPXT_10215 [Terracidiphilus sp.]
MAEQDSVVQTWLPIIGKALVLTCMQSTDLGNKTIAERAQFLESFGINLKDAADMLGTSPASVRELLRLAKKKTQKRGSKSNANAKKKGRKGS